MNLQSELYRLRTTLIFAIGAGSGTPVICLHGITANAYVFEPVIGLLAERFRMVSIDQRGHGRSGRPPSYSAEDFAADTAALVERLGAGPAILLGHSLGARNALVTANRYPELVRAVVAVDFTPFIEPEILTELQARVRGGDRAFADRKALEAYLCARYPLLPADAIRRRARYGYRNSPEGLRPLADARAMDLIAEGLKADLAAEMRALKQRSVLVRGASSKLVSPAAWRKTRELRPDVEAVEIAAADHYVPEEQPAAIAALVRRVAET